MVSRKSPGSTFDGSEYWLTWSLSQPEALSPAGIQLQNITPEGELGPVVALLEDGLWPNLAGSPNGQLLLSYTVPDPDAGGSSRISSRLLGGSSDVPARGAGGFGGAGAVGSGAGPAAGSGSTSSASGGANSATGGSPQLTGGVAASNSGGPRAGGSSWPGGVGPMPSCSYAERSQTGSRAPLSWLAGVALAISLSLARRKRGRAERA